MEFLNEAGVREKLKTNKGKHYVYILHHKNKVPFLCWYRNKYRWKP